MSHAGTLFSGAIAMSIAMPIFGIDAGHSVLEEVTVSAQKYAQSRLHAPLAVTVIGADQLAVQHPVALEDALARVPGLYADRAAGGIPRLFIRGIGDWSDQQNKRVSFLIDGVPQTQAYLQDPALSGATARVEIIKGPQGTLYGRGAVAGVISVVSMRPTEMTSSLRVSYGNLDSHELVASLALPLATEGWAMAFDGRLSGREAWEENDFSGSPERDERRLNGRLRLEGRLGENGRFLLSAYGVDDRTAPMRLAYLDRASGRAVKLSPGDAGIEASPLRDYHVERDFIGRTRTHAQGASAQLDWNMLGGDWRSITSYSTSDIFQRNDADGTAVATMKFNHDPYSLDQRFVYQEVIGRFSPAQTLQLQLGGSASMERYLTSTRFDLAAFAMTLESRLRTKSYAVFAQADWDLRPDLTATVGLRRQEDRYRFKDVSAAARQRSEDGSTAWRVALGWRPSQVFNPYISVATAQTPAGINTTPATTNVGTVLGTYSTYDAEHIESVEAGIKGVGTRWRYDLAAYHSRLDDQQLYNPANTQIENLGKTRFRGVEAEGTAVLTTGMELTVSAAWTDSEILRDDSGTGVGQRVPNIARVTGRATLSGEMAFAGGSLRADLTGRYRDKSWADAANTLRVKSTTFVDLDIRWQRGAYWLGLNAANLTDKVSFSQVFPVSSFAPEYGQVAWAQPRTFWLRVGYEW